MVGFPKNIRALYVDQLEGGSEQGSVLEVVMAADRDVVRWRQQAALLQVCAPRARSLVSTFVCTEPPAGPCREACRPAQQRARCRR